MRYTHTPHDGVLGRAQQHIHAHPRSHAHTEVRKQALWGAARGKYAAILPPEARLHNHEQPNDHEAYRLPKASSPKCSAMSPLDIWTVFIQYDSPSKQRRTYASMATRFAMAASKSMALGLASPTGRAFVLCLFDPVFLDDGKVLQ